MDLIKKDRELAIIERFAARLKNKNKSVVVPIGDDAAAVRGARGKYDLYTADMLVESVHFKKGESLKKVGYKAIAVCLSDIAAMGGLPKYALVSVGLPRKTPDKAIKALISGIALCAKKFNVDVVGGDTNRSPTLVIDVFMVGEALRGELVLRSCAKSGDYIFVSGPLGGSQRVRHLTFQPRLRQSRFLVENFKVTSMIDLSDGLGRDLSRICKASKVGAIIFEDRIPKSRGVLKTESALFDGEDFELLFTLSKSSALKLIAMMYTKGGIDKFYHIGKITHLFDGIKMITRDAKLRRLPTGGFRHF